MLTESNRELPAPHIRWLLIAALIAAMSFAVLLFRSFGPLIFGPISGTGSSGPLVFIESLPALAILLLILPTRGRLARIGAGVAYVASALIAHVSFGMAIWQAPSPYGRSRPAPLNTTQSLVGVTLAVAAAMFCASYYARGSARKAANIITVVYLTGWIVLKTLVFR
jgi:hypothetical protein